MRRRFFALLLVLTMVLSMAVGVSAAGEDSQLVLDVTQGKGSVTIAVSLEDCADVTNGRFTVGYDADVLTLADVQTTDAYAMHSVNSETAGTVAFAWVGSELTEEKTLMVTLTLEASSGITRDLTFTADADGIYIGTGEVQVAGDSVTITVTTPVDTTELEKAVETAEGLNGDDYTDESWAALEDALTAGLAVLADADATQDEVDAAAQRLNQAIAALVPAESTGVDTTELEKAIEKAEGLDESKYTDESYAAVEEALEKAKAVLADPDATQAEVDAAAKALNDAIAALKKPGSEPPKTGDDSQTGLWIGLMTVSGLGIAALLFWMLRSGKSKQASRIICLLLTVTMLLSASPVSVFAAAVEGQDMEAGPKGDTEGLDELVDQRESAIVDAETGELVGTITEIDAPGADIKLDQQTAETVAPYAEDEMVRVIVELEGAGLLEQGYTQSQIAAYGTRVASDARKLEKLQNNVTARIQGIAAEAGLTAEVKYNYTVALNGVAMTVPYGTLAQIRQLEGVKGAYVVSQYQVPETEATDETSMYATSESFGSAQTWAELGYTGAGMTIAVIDTGLDTDHPSFAAAPEGASMTMADVEAVLTELNAYTLYRQTSAVKLDADDLYRSEKVPFGFNYVDCGLEVTHDYDSQGDHGTHVAGIAAANALDTTSVVGVAPDAQVVVMKVFGQNGGAYSDDIIAAIEDCVLLGVDVINMSLGSQAGFTEDSQLVNEVYGRILQTDMILAVAAGNSNSSATGNALGTNLNLTQDPDNGLVNSPATYLAATAVASLENSAMMMPYFSVGENKIAYVDVTYYKFAALAGTYEYVVIPGVGEKADYEGLDVSGKVALVQRGTIDFTTKQENAYNAGAVALVVYDNVDGDLVSMYDGGFLPNVFISKADGEIMLSAAENGVGTMVIEPYGSETAIPSSVAGLLSDFSCWGVTSDLQLTPDVTAPGGNIYSCYTDGAYGTMSGTSMASPHIAGMSALVLQYLHECYPDMTGAEMHIAAEALIMSTAVPVYDPDGILYSPRKQGAGSANVYSAVTSPVYLTSYQESTGELTPKASMGDDADRTGVYTFSFDMHNMSDAAQTYVLDGMLLTDQYVEIDGREFMGEIGRNLTGEVSFQVLNSSLLPQYDANQDGVTDMLDVQFLLDVVNDLETLDETLTDVMDLHADGVLNTVDCQILYELLLNGFEAQEVVIVPANSSITVNVTVTLSDEDKAYMEAHYENGIYVDGFVRAYAQTEGAVDLSLPFVGFYGDWHDARMFDSGWYYEDEETVEYNRYLNVVFATLGNTGSYAGLGINPYILEDYDPEHNVLSPNGDTYYDYVPEIYISLMRSAELLDFTWTDEDGNELFYEWYSYARKSYYWSGYGMCMPVIYTDGGCVPYTFYDENGNLMVEDLDHLTLTIRGYLDDGDLDDVAVDADGNPIPDAADADDVIEIPVVIDMTAPRIDISSIVYSTDDGRSYVTFDVEDNYDIAAVVAMTMGGGSYEYIPVTTKEPGVDGEKATVTIDITDFDASFQIVLCDYGCNESYYQLTNEYNTGLAEDRFYAFRRYSTIETSDTIYTTDALNGWYSFESADAMTMHTSQSSSGEATVYAAEYVDGYIFGAQGGEYGYNTMFVMKAGSWERTQLGSGYEMNKYVYEWPGQEGTYFPLKMIALDMTYDYTTGKMYMLTNALENNYFPEGEINILCEVDIQTGAVTVLGKIFPAEGEEFLALTLACDSDGTLYTINYETGMLYTIDKTPTETTEQYGYGTYIATNIDADGKTEYYPAAYTQSMTFDADGELYWAAYQGKVGVSCFIHMDKQTGAIESLTYTADNAELSGLFTVKTPTEDIIPEAELEGITLSAGDLYLNVGQTATLTVSPIPYNAAVGQVEWTCADESVATVSPNGIVEAKSVGSTTVTATCADGIQASCTVNVSSVDGTLFAYSDGSWLLMDAGKPFQASQIVDAMALEGEISAATYLHGYIYAAALEEGYDEDYNPVYTTNLYKLDASTLQGELVGSYVGDTTALAFNYADGFLYGLTREETYDADWNFTTSYNLIRVNPSTAETIHVTNLDSIYTCSDLLWEYETCSGALAIDYEGNFYVNGDNSNWEYNLVRFNLENDQIANVTEFEGFCEYSYGGDAMVWSQRNGGLLYINGNELKWVDVSDMSSVTTIALGQVRGAGYNVLALAIPLTSEPETPTVAPTELTLEESYEIPVGETVKVVPTLNPWNASGSFTFAIADESIATVDADGVITGLTEGETTVTVTEAASGLSATAAVVVGTNPGSLYAYFQANLQQQIPLEAWGKMPIADPNGYEFITDSYELTIYGATYYDGTVYAVGQHSTDGKYYFLKISPSNFSYVAVCEADILVRGMAFDYTTGAMFVLGSTEVIKGGLFQMDLETCDLTYVADNDLGSTLVAIACDDEGRLYVADDYGEVYTMDKTDGTIWSTGLYGNSSPYLQAMAYDYNNDAIYWANGGTLWQVDVQNGDLISLGSTGCSVSAMFTVPDEEIEVPETVEPMGVAMGEKNTVAVGETLAVEAVVLPVSVATVDQTLTWTSYDETIATVDQNGVVTGVAPGEVYIEAMDSQGNSDTILITVTAEHRYFYGYDELSRSWVSFDTDGVIVNTWADEEGLSPIVAAQYLDGVLYAYDEDGYFYTVDTETFQRTKLGNGINGLTTSLEAWDKTHDEQVYFVDGIPYRMIDLDYSVVAGRRGTVTTLYGVMMAWNISEWRDSFSYKVVELDMTTGEISQVIVEDQLVDYEMSLRPTNLLYRDGLLYTVNGYITGMVTAIDPTFGDVSGTAIFPEYWGDFNGGRSLIEDPLTGETYAIRDMRTEYIGTPGYTGAYSTSELCTIDLGIARCEEVATIGTNMRITGLFIK